MGIKKAREVIDAYGLVQINSCHLYSVLKAYAEEDEPAKEDGPPYLGGFVPTHKREKNMKWVDVTELEGIYSEFNEIQFMSSPTYRLFTAIKRVLGK